MKRILSTLFFLLLVVASFAQNNGDHLKFMGIPLTGNITQFQSKLIAKGCTLDKISSANALNGLRIFNGSFAGNKVKIIVFYNPQNKIVYRAKALLDGVSEDRAEQEYYKIKSLLSQKYGSDYMETSENEGREACSFPSLKTNGQYVDSENAADLSEVINGRIDIYIGIDAESWIRSPFNYNLHIDYNDYLNSQQLNADMLEDL